MGTAEDLIKEIKSRPEQVEPWLVYCDWLEDNESDRVAEIRKQLQLRLPYSASEFEKFRPWAKSASRSPSDEDVVFTTIPKEYRKDVDTISKEKLFRNFERDLDGRLPLKRQVVFAFYSNEPWTLRRQPCLVATSPARRRDDQCLTIGIENLILRNQPHNWSAARWLWDKDVDPPKTLLKTKDVLFKNAAQTVKDLQAKSKLNERQQRLLSTHLLDVGRYKEALEMFGLRWDDSMECIRNRIPYVVENSAVSKTRARLISKGKPDSGATRQRNWKIASLELKTFICEAQGFREQLWHAAPWKFKQTIDKVFKLRRVASKSKRECKLRLFAFPKQTQASKRAVFIGCNKEGEDHRIYVDYSSVNDRLTLVDWQRDFWFDMKRLEIT